MSSPYGPVGASENGASAKARSENGAPARARSDTPSAGRYGVVDAARSVDRLEVIVEEITRVGYAVVPGVLSPAQVTEYGEALDAVYARQAAEVGGEDNLRAIRDADVARCLLAYDARFLDLAAHALLLDACRRVLGENFVLLMQNGVINRSSAVHYQSNWHRDLNYQHWVCTRPLALSALFCLDPFSVETGGTEFLAGSHLRPDFPSEAFVRAYARGVEAPAGSVVLMDSMVFHRAGFNRSGRVRRAVNHVIGVPILAQQISIPDMLGGRHADDPFLGRYLGYRWAPKADVRAWRLQRLGDGGAGG